MYRKNLNKKFLKNFGKEYVFCYEKEEEEKRLLNPYKTEGRGHNGPPNIKTDIYIHMYIIF